MRLKIREFEKQYSEAPRSVLEKPHDAMRKLNAQDCLFIYLCKYTIYSHTGDLLFSHDWLYNN